MRDTSIPADLSVLALRYAAGDLPAAEMAAFEERLATDQPAREALSEAIRLSASAIGQPLPLPSDSVRIGIRERLFPTWISQLFPRRSYRGHPVAWVALGSLVATSVSLCLLTGGSANPDRAAMPPVLPVPVVQSPIPAGELLQSETGTPAARVPVDPKGSTPVVAVPAMMTGPRVERELEHPQPMPNQTVVRRDQKNS